MKQYYNMDITERYDGMAAEGAKVQDVYVKSTKTGRKYSKQLTIPADVEINENTVIYLKSSTNEYNNLDRIDIAQKDEDKPARVFLRSENGTYKEKLPDPNKKTNAPVYPVSEKTYEI